MRKTSQFLISAAPLALLALVATPQVAWADGTAECNFNAGPDGDPLTGDNPVNTLECGEGAAATLLGATAVGPLAQATAQQSTAVGYAAEAQKIDSTAVGHDATAAGVESIAVGARATAGGYGSTVVGTDASAADSGTALGWDSRASFDAVAVGSEAHASAQGAVAIGARDVDGNISFANADYSVAVGAGATTTTTARAAVVVGGSALATGFGGIAIGTDAEAQEFFTRFADDPQRNQAAYAKFMTRLATNRSPQDALNWSASLPQPASGTARVFSQWQTVAPQEAAAWLAALPQSTFKSALSD